MVCAESVLVNVWPLCTKRIQNSYLKKAAGGNLEDSGLSSQQLMEVHSFWAVWKNSYAEREGTGQIYN